MKRMDLSRFSSKERSGALQEADLLSQLSHPNIVKLREWFTSSAGDKLYIVMSYCEGGDIYHRSEKTTHTHRERESEIDRETKTERHTHRPPLPWILWMIL
jgi:serine/threonine protein kinase